MSIKARGPVEPGPGGPARRGSTIVRHRPGSAAPSGGTPHLMRSFFVGCAARALSTPDRPPPDVQVLASIAALVRRSLPSRGLRGSRGGRARYHDKETCPEPLFLRGVPVGHGRAEGQEP